MICYFQITKINYTVLHNTSYIYIHSENTINIFCSAGKQLSSIQNYRKYYCIANYNFLILSLYYFEVSYDSIKMYESFRLFYILSFKTM